MQRISAVAAAQSIAERAADQNLGIGDGIACRVTARVRRTIESGIHARARTRIIDRIRAKAAIQRICARTANERVVPGLTEQLVAAGAANEGIVAVAAVQRVIADIAAQRIALRRTDHPLDGGKRIARSIAARRNRTVEIDAHRAGRGGIVRRIEASAAVQRISARAAAECIVTCAAEERVCGAAARERIVTRAAFEDIGEGRAGQAVAQHGAQHALDAGECITRRIARTAGSCAKVDGDRAGRGRVVGGIEAVAAGQDVRPGKSGQRIIARLPEQRIRTRAAAERIGKGRALDRLYPRQRIARRIPAAARSAVRRNRDAAGRVRIVGHVDP